MPDRPDPFAGHVDRYDAWYDRNFWVYVSELTAIRSVLPDFTSGLEVGAGTGRFCAPLRITQAVEPSPDMAKIARSRGIEVTEAVAEALPFSDASFDLVLVVTVLCFLDDVTKAFAEFRRVLVHSGALVIGMIDRNSPGGAKIQAHKATDPFFRHATLQTVPEIKSLLEQAGFEVSTIRQTVFDGPDAAYRPESVKDGYGECMFVVIRATRR